MRRTQVVKPKAMLCAPLNTLLTNMGAALQEIGENVKPAECSQTAAAFVEAHPKTNTTKAYYLGRQFVVITSRIHRLFSNTITQENAKTWLAWSMLGP